MELWEVLDKEGNKIGKTMEKNEEGFFNRGFCHLGAEVWIINSENKIVVLHHAPALSYRINNHNLYIGPLLSHVFQLKPVWNDKYDNKAFGLHFGYRYYSNELLRNFRIFGQFHYSIFWVKCQYYQLGLPDGVTKTEIRVNNTASFGVDYEAIPNLHIYAGTGFGSYDGFFLILERVNLSEYIGIKYEF